MDIREFLVDSWHRKWLLFFSKTFRPACCSFRFRVLALRIKRPGSEVNNSPPSGVDVNKWSFNTTHTGAFLACKSTTFLSLVLRFPRRFCWKFRSCGMWRFVAGLVFPGVSKVRSAYTFKGTPKPWKTMILVPSKRRVKITKWHIVTTWRTWIIKL
jgi:hypothetical protein